MPSEDARLCGRGGQGLGEAPWAASKFAPRAAEADPTPAATSDCDGAAARMRLYPEKRSIPGPPTPRPFKTEGWRRVERYSDRVTDCTAEPAAESSRAQAPRASSAGGAAAVCAEESGVSLFPRRRQHRRRRETALSLALVPTKSGV